MVMKFGPVEVVALTDVHPQLSVVEAVCVYLHGHYHLRRLYLLILRLECVVRGKERPALLGCL